MMYSTMLFVRWNKEAKNKTGRREEGGGGERHEPRECEFIRIRDVEFIETSSFTVYEYRDE